MTFRDEAKGEQLLKRPFAIVERVICQSKMKWVEFRRTSQRRCWDPRSEEERSKPGMRTRDVVRLDQVTPSLNHFIK